MKPLIFVTVGTDHHPFDRVIRWVDGWLEAGGAEKARCLIQTGTSSQPRRAEGKHYLTYEEMEEAVNEAVAVVCHGGPATIMLSRYLGKKPIVVPRQHRLGEHVDNHQVAFSRRIAAEGEVELVETQERLWELLEQVVRDPGFLRLLRTENQVKPAVSRFEEMVGVLCPTRLKV